MKYLIRMFQHNEEQAFEEYEFDQLPYMPRIGETVFVGNFSYIVTNIESSFDDIESSQFMINYTVREVCC